MLLKGYITQKLTNHTFISQLAGKSMLVLPAYYDAGWSLNYKCVQYCNHKGLLECNSSSVTLANLA